MFVSTRLRLASTLLLTVAAFTLITHRCVAQRAPESQPPSAGQPAAVNVLHLTPSQQQHIMAIKLKFNALEVNVIKSSSLTNDQKIEKIEALRQSAIAQFKACLTPSQTQIYNAENAKAKSKMKTVVALRQANADQCAPLQKELRQSLSPEQSQHLNAIKININQQWTKFQSGSHTPSEMKNEADQLQASFQQQSRSVLNAQQLALLDHIATLSGAEAAKENAIMEGY
jgi:hypothetical protein